MQLALLFSINEHTCTHAVTLQWSMHPTSTFAKADHWIGFCSTAVHRAAFKQWRVLC